MDINNLLRSLRLRRQSQWDDPTLLDTLLSLSPLESLTHKLYRILLFLRGRPFYPPRTRPPVRVVCISDTHGRTLAVPSGDLLVHAGDLTDSGSPADIQKQIDWIAAMPHRHKVVVCGNHDEWFDEEVRRRKWAGAGAGAGTVDLKGVKYLEGSGCELVFDGGRRLMVWGAPDVPRCGGEDGDFAFQYEHEEAFDVWEDRIPMDTDILITHGPPFGHLDLNLGCPALLDELWRVKPRLHIFGHVHCGAGSEAVYFNDAQLARESLAARPKSGLLGDLFPSWAWVDAVKVLVFGARGVLWKWIMLGPGGDSGSLLVNAGVMVGNTGRVRGTVQVVDL